MGMASKKPKTQIIVLRSKKIIAHPFDARFSGASGKFKESDT